jgi:anti-sigma B factor antagonist
VTLLADLTEERHGDVMVVAIAGEVDASNAAEIGERLRRMTPNEAKALLVDLSETVYLDSAGINTLFALHSELHDRRQQLLLVVPDGNPMKRTLQIAGLDETVTLHPTRDAALARPEASAG